MVTAEPACSPAADAVLTKRPAPIIAPMPNAIRLPAVSVRLSCSPCSDEATSCAIDFFTNIKNAMDLTQIALWVLGGICAALGWFARELYGATQSLRKDLSSLEVRIGTDYVRYDRLQDALKPIMDSLHDIKVALIGKVDK